MNVAVTKAQSSGTFVGAPNPPQAALEWRGLLVCFL